ncbi:MAG: toll/interleukin-1 receptor domain-containing protein [Myxococcota bacterium]
MLHWTRWGALALAGISGCDGSGWVWGLVVFGAASLFFMWGGPRSTRKPRLGDLLSKLGPGKRGEPVRVEPLRPRRRDTGAFRATADPEPAPPLPGDDVQFTVYRPDAIAPERWTDLLVFAHLARQRPDAPPDAPDPLDEVRRQAAAFLGEALPHFADLRADAAAAVPREGELVLVPTIEGVRFNPPQRSVLWLEDVHAERFKMFASPALDGQTARGRLLVRLGAIVLADIPLAIPVRADAPQNTQVLPAESGTPYRRIFASYSHRDVEVVHQFERYAKGIGDRYLRDVVHLRSGEVWSEALERLIDEADVFQLFWSQHSMRSPYVRQEWEYALALARPNFVRPTYWTRPLPEDPAANLPPQALRDLEFGYIGTEDEGAVPPPALGPDAPPGSPPTDQEKSAHSRDGLTPTTQPEIRRRVPVTGSYTLSAEPQRRFPSLPWALLGGALFAAAFALIAWAVQRCGGG